MVPSRRRAGIEFPILRFTVGMLIPALAMVVPLAAQKPEQRSSMQCDKTEALCEYQKKLQDNPRSSGTVALTFSTTIRCGHCDRRIHNIW
jgi:hypothetical protein